MSPIQCASAKDWDAVSIFSSPLLHLCGDYKGQSFTKNTEPTFFSRTKTNHSPDPRGTFTEDTFASTPTTPPLFTAQHPHPSFLHRSMPTKPRSILSQLGRCTGRTTSPSCNSDHNEGCTPSTQSSATWMSLVTPLVLLPLQWHHVTPKKALPPPALLQYQ